MRNVVGPRVRAARYRSGEKVTQEDLVARLQGLGVNVDRTVISKIESGNRIVTDVEILAISKALKVSIGFLFGEEG